MTEPAFHKLPTPDYAGIREYGISSEYHVIVGLYDGTDAFDTSCGRWQTVCERHHTIASHATLTLARQHLPYPGEWCEACRAAQEREFVDDYVVRVTRHGPSYPPSYSVMHTFRNKWGQAISICVANCATVDEAITEAEQLNEGRCAA